MKNGPTKAPEPHGDLSRGVLAKHDSNENLECTNECRTSRATSPCGSSLTFGQTGNSDMHTTAAKSSNPLNAEGAKSAEGLRFFCLSPRPPRSPRLSGLACSRSPCLNPRSPNQSPQRNAHRRGLRRRQDFVFMIELIITRQPSGRG